MLIEDPAQAHDEIRPEWRTDKEMLAGKPGEEAIAYKSMAEMSGKKAQSAAISIKTKALAEAHPARPQRAVCVDDAFGLAGGA